MKNKLITPAVLDALKRWYLAERLTQERIARIAGVNRSCVNAWLAGDARAIRGVYFGRVCCRICASISRQKRLLPMT